MVCMEEVGVGHASYAWSHQPAGFSCLIIKRKIVWSDKPGLLHHNPGGANHSFINFHALKIGWVARLAVGIHGPSAGMLLVSSMAARP